MIARVVVVAMVAVDLLVVFVVGEWYIGSGLCGAEDSALRQTLHCSVDNELCGGVNSDGWHIDSSSSVSTGDTSC